MKRGAPMKRTGRLRPVGARAKRDGDARAIFRAHVLERSGGVCERCLRSSAFGRVVRIDAHHIVGRGRGVGWPRLHDPELNGLGVCADACHPELTLDPKDQKAPRGRMDYQKRIARAFAAFDRWRAGS